MNKYRLFREAIADKGLILWDSFTGWSVLMHFHNQTSTKNISTPPPHLLRRLPCTRQNTKPCSLKQDLCRKQTLSTSDTASHTGWHLVCAGRTSETPGVILQKEYLCFCLSLRHNDLPLSGSSAAPQPVPGRHWAAAATRWQSLGTFTTALLPRNASGKLILCSRWLSRWFLASSIITVYIYRLIKDSNKRLFD